MADLNELCAKLNERFGALLEQVILARREITIEVAAQHIQELCLALRDQPEFDFKCLIDVCGVDYLHYGLGEWETTSATATGFERGAEYITNCTPEIATENKQRGRFAAVYHLLSLTHNQRLRIRTYLDAHHPAVDSVVDIWPAANWFEREAFDLFGIMFTGHPDLRRLLTDYGFVGHPFRKDFPISGKTEVRYDAKLRRVVYEPVSIEPRILEPKVIRRDNRYQVGE
jgi:NADH-quinone oxidoreductase subunit C